MNGKRTAVSHGHGAEFLAGVLTGDGIADWPTEPQSGLVVDPTIQNIHSRNMGRPFYGNADFLNAALALVAERGPSGVTVGAITARLKAPTGSFYHRFTSRDALLGELWLQTVLAFSEGLNAALEGGDGLKAALHTPAWVREHMDEGRLLLLYHRDDFVDGEWPPELRQKVADHTYRSKLAVPGSRARSSGSDGPDAYARASFVLAQVPVAAVLPYLRRGEPPPALVERAHHQ